MSTAKKCPTCESPSPELHPAVQWEGEVQPCRDIWHATYQVEALKVAYSNCVAQERERCARIADLYAQNHWRKCAMTIAAKIREGQS